MFLLSFVGVEFMDIANEMLKDIGKIRSKALIAQREDIELDNLITSIDCDALHGRVVGRQEVIDQLSEFLHKYSTLLNSPDKGADTN